MGKLDHDLLKEAHVDGSKYEEPSTLIVSILNVLQADCCGAGDRVYRSFWRTNDPELSTPRMDDSRNVRFSGTQISKVSTFL